MGHAIQAEAIHPDLWRASQLGSAQGRTVASGHAELDAELPGRGWPTGALSEVLVPQPGCGELRLLKPALESVARRPVFVLQPPHRLQPAALAWWGLSVENVRVLKAPATADCLWAAEQILRSGTAGALLFWQQQVRPEALRRLHLAHQSRRRQCVGSTGLLLPLLMVRLLMSRIGTSSPNPASGQLTNPTRR